MASGSNSSEIGSNVLIFQSNQRTDIARQPNLEKKGNYQWYINLSELDDKDISESFWRQLPYHLRLIVPGPTEAKHKKPIIYLRNGEEWYMTPSAKSLLEAYNIRLNP